jgi:hypothetical protein
LRSRVLPYFLFVNRCFTDTWRLRKRQS